MLVLLASVVAMVAMGAGAVWAYFAVSGTGSGVAAVAKATAVVIEHSSGTVSPGLSPGHDGDLRLTIDNPNPAAVVIVAIAGKGTVTVTGGTGCTAGDAGVSVVARSGLAVEVPHGTHAVTIATGVQMGATSADGCQGATFEIPVTLTVEER